MTESYLTDSELNALSGTSDAEQGVAYPTIYESPYYTSFYKMLYRLLDVARRAGDLRVFKDGDLTFGARAGRYLNGDTAVNYAGAAEQSLTNNATNYIYLTAAGVLTVNTTGFPTPSVTPHLPLATILTAAGVYDHDDITDYRGRTMLTVAGANAGNLNSLDWQASVADELDFTSAEPAAPSLGDRYLNTGSGTSSETSQTVAAGDIEEWNGTTWTEITPEEGYCCLVEDRDMLIAYNGSAWVDIGTFALLNEAQTFFAATDITGAQAETLTDGSNADALHIHDTAGLADTAVTAAKLAADAVETAKIKDANVTAAKLATAVQDLIPTITLTGSDDADGTGVMAIQVKDAAGNNLSERFLVRTWIADAEFSEPDPQTGFAVGTGEQMRAIEANADYEVITNASGYALMGINTATDKTVYVMAEIDGRIYTGSVAITGN